MARLNLEVTGSGTTPSASKHDEGSPSFDRISSAVFFFLGGVIVLAILMIIFFVVKKFVKTADLKIFIAHKLNCGSPSRTKVQVLRSTLHDIIYFDFQTLKKATKNFRRSNLLGKGGFGPVYLKEEMRGFYGKFLPTRTLRYAPIIGCVTIVTHLMDQAKTLRGKLEDGKLVAVKQLSLGKSQQGESEFLAEVKMITSIQHKNLVRLLGCCSDGAQRLLVYEYMKNGSLDLIVYGKKDVFLNWNTRCQIILGVARGLQYLHEDSHLRIVHRDIKASNILLDDKFQPRIGDFGLARFFPEDQAFLSATFGGTLGYTAPEYAIRGELSEKADIYSFGVLVLEIISCRKNTDYDLSMDKQYLPEYAWKLNEKSKLMDLLDPKLHEEDVVEKDVIQVLNVAFLCLQPLAHLRPPMSEVVAMLTCKAEVGGEVIRQALLKQQNNEKDSGETISVEFSPSSQSNMSISFPK